MAAKQSINKSSGVATRDDFNNPKLGEQYERFLSFLVMAELKDRLRAMEIRRDEGLESALAFLGKCTLTSEDTESSEEDGNDDLSAKYTLLRNPDNTDVSIFDLCYSVGAIASALDRVQDDGGDVDTVPGLASALKVIGAQLVHAQGSVESDDEYKISKAFSQPDTEAESMRNRLQGTGFELWLHPLNGTYAVSDRHGRMQLSIVSIREIENWLESEGIESAAKGSAAVAS